MNFTKVMIRVLAAACALAGTAMADVELATKNEDVSLKLYGDVGLQAGQAVKYFYKDSKEYGHQWVQQSLMHFGVHAEMHK